MDRNKLEIVLAAKDGASKVLGDVGKSFDGLQKDAEQFGKGMQKVGLVMAGVGAGLTVFAKKSTDMLVDMVKETKTMARETGASVEESSKLLAATRRLGISAEESSAMFGIFSKKIAESRGESAENALKQAELRNKIEKTRLEIASTTKEMRTNGDSSGELRNKLGGLNLQLQSLEQDLKKVGSPLDALNIKTKNADGSARSFHDILLNVADRFRTLPDGAEKTALAMELFGRSGRDMIKVLNLGSQGILELEANAEKLGLTLTSSNIASVSAYIESQKRLKDVTDGIKISVGTLTAPVLTEFNTRLAETATKLMSLNGVGGQVITTILAFGGPVLTATGAMLGFLGSIVQAGPALAKMLGFFANPITLAFAAALVVVAGAAFLLRERLGSWQAVLDYARNAFQGFYNLLSTAVTPSLTALWTNIQTQLLPALQRLWTHVEPLLGPALKAMAYYIGGLLVAQVWLAVNVLNVITRVISFFTSALSNASQWSQNLASAIWSMATQSWAIIRNSFSSVEAYITAPFRVAMLIVGDIVGRINGFIDSMTGRLRALSNAMNEARGTAANIGQRILDPLKLIHRQHGGPVSGNRPYIVGEAGPEIFTPTKSGYIQPNNTIAGGSTTNITGPINLYTAEATDRFFDRLNRQDQLVGMGLR